MYCLHPLKKIGQKLSYLFGLYTIYDGVEATGNYVKHNRGQLSVIRVLWEAMHQNGQHST